MKKIQILESNNHLTDNQINTLTIPDPGEYDDLMNYVYQSVDFSGLNELEIFLKVMSWVNERWSHDGLNDAGSSSSLEILKRASNGETFRCVEYAKVTKDILLSMGYIARALSVQSVNADYGGLGQGHVVTEVWSNDLNKWVFLDAQLNCYALKENVPLSYYEIYKSFDEVSFIILGDNPMADKNEYKEFIKNYFGYIKVQSMLNGVEIELFLYLEGKRQLLAFQGMELSNALFTDKLDEVYFNPNKATILFEYKESIDVGRIIKENNLVSENDFMENYHLFYAKPNFHLKFITNTPNLDYYELKINDNVPLKLITGTYDWSLNEGINQIAIWSVNKQGIRGSVTKMKLLYQ